MRRGRNAVRAGLLAMAALVALTAGLFVANGTSRAWRTPDAGTTDAPARVGPAREVRVLAFNLAKLGFHRGGLEFAPREAVLARLDTLAALLREERVDLACLSEIVLEGGPSKVDQVRTLAERAGFHAWAFGENYRFGLPFLRIRAGNAILSRFPLRPLEVVQLPGQRPFWDPTGNRRLLWAEAQVGDLVLRVGSVRNDSFDLANNERQVRALLEALPPGPALLAGDFNAEPNDPPLRLLQESARFTGRLEGPSTYPRTGRRIDYVLAPAGWRLVEERVLPLEVSDHLPVLAVFAP
jgi:endonuclease/exonuclease/phosphatase family metal-dependent hydrolase